jgi:septal ring factor EnvC (AmiA/AmiB activator)
MFKKVISGIGGFVAVVGVVTLAVFVILSFLNMGKTNQKIAELNQSIKEHTKIIEQLSSENHALNETNDALVEKIEGLKKETESNSAAIEQGVKDAKELANNRPPAPVECKEIIEYMQKEIDAYVENFSLAIRDRDTWKQIASDFDLAYQNQKKITINLQTTIDLISSDSLLKDEVIKSLKKDLTINKLKGGVIAGGMVAILIGMMIYGMLK